MPVTVTFPTTLPCVSRIDGYSLDSSAALLRSPFDAGNARQRRMHIIMPTEIALTWRASNAQLQPLFAWLNTYGFDWFKLTLAGIEASLAGLQSKAIDVRLMSDVQVALMQFHRSNWWTLKASAEYVPAIAALHYA
jgi:hypothetical protein